MLRRLDEVGGQKEYFRHQIHDPISNHRIWWSNASVMKPSLRIEKLRGSPFVLRKLGIFIIPPKKDGEFVYRGINILPRRFLHFSISRYQKPLSKITEPGTIV